MMAAVLYGKEHLQVEPVAVPKSETGALLVRVRVALTCGTDFKVFRRGYHARMIVPPAVFGHELAGEIDAIGEGAALPGSTPNVKGPIGTHRISNMGGDGGPVTLDSHRHSNTR